MPASSSDYFAKTGIGTATTLAAPGHTIGGTTFNVGSTAAYPTTTGVFFAVDSYDTLTGARVPGTYTVWQGEVQNSTTFANCVLRYGTDQNYTAGSTTRVYMPITNARENRLVDGLLVSHYQDGTLIPSAVQTALGTGNLANTGFNALGQTPNTVTYNGNRSYTCVFNGVDLSTTLSAGMRIRTTRTLAAPTRSTSLNGTSQYWSKTSPAGMTFTDDFTLSAWVKISSYASSAIVSKWDGTNGWRMALSSSGQPFIQGVGSGANRLWIAYQSIPLNKWVHIACTLDMSGSTSSTNKVYIDGIDVPAQMTSNTGTALSQGTGPLQIGAFNGAEPFPGKIAQAAVFSAVLSAATIQSYYSQGITSSAPSLVSAYSFDGNANDINTTNANNLTANGSAVATNTDSPFGGQADGTISSTLDYGIVQKVTFSTNTTVIVQVAEGCTIPTTGGVTSVAYSSQKAPYGFPSETDRWVSQAIYYVRTSLATASNTTWYNQGHQLVVPIGSWNLEYETYTQITHAGTVGLGTFTTLGTTSSSSDQDTIVMTPTISVSIQQQDGYNTKSITRTLSASTTYFLNTKPSSNTSTIYVGQNSNTIGTFIKARNAYL